MTRDAESRIGLDVGSSAIKIIQVSGPADKPTVTGIGYKDISGLSGTEISDSLKSLATECRITAKDAAISLSGPSVIVRFITLPKMDESALKGAIRYEAEKFIPYNISDCIIDFQTLRKDEKENRLSILLVAAKKEYAQEKMKLVEAAGFSVRAVDVDSFALANAFLKNHEKMHLDKSYAILNIGGVHTNVSILKGDSIYFSRDIALGGNDFTLAISRKLGIDQKSAEELKLRPPKDKESGIMDCIKGTFNDLLDEVKLSFGYYENQAGKGVDEIYVSGGTSDIIGMEQVFEEMLGSKPAFWNSLEFMDTSSGSINPDLLKKKKNVFSVAAGLVLR